MVTVEVWERGKRLSGLLRQLLPGEMREGLRIVPAGELPGEMRPDLVVLAPCWRGGGEGGICRCLLSPGSVGGLTGRFSAGWVVSYGLDRRDTLTLSAMEGGRLCVALQRELVTLDGTTVEGQERPLSNGMGLSPAEALACVGVQLLLGVPPERVRLE